ncbi:MAG: D-alanyl-D-alanine carboxypeptidase/D-alanyl-D-alanine-endopeptidase [Tannerella sp.]|jgi:D-alanyl-D-alanine carboxypeptidase/D-alanyl-D-alanine-endopeptidase (penicillin-binding protein 4)|nr:D-alanyl-D-alanine carboxypeptidase/D-alanyl-D-alanine-endopeptidase [Tannerella sp.]
MRKIFAAVIFLSSVFPGKAQTHPAIERFLRLPHMRGASVSIMIRDIRGDSVIYACDAEREVIPASVMKTVTTAAVLEILGENFRYETAIMHDGQIRDSVLHGNIYIRGSGDPTTGSAATGTDRNRTFREWTTAVRNAGIRKITGAVIADESIFDTEGISMKWLREDLGSYYGQGCYGLNVYDNRYSLFLDAGEAGSRPVIARCEPDMPEILFHNYLTAGNADRDSAYITGLPYSAERYLYGMIPANRSGYRMDGDIPDPALFLAKHFAELLKGERIEVAGDATCHRLLMREGKWEKRDQTVIATTYSPPLKEIVRITNHTSNNLYADALLKTAGLKYRPGEIISSFGKGIGILHEFWSGKGLDTSSLWMYDGSGLSPSDRATAAFLCALLSYMATQSSAPEAFTESLPRAGMDGTVANMLKGSALQGRTRLKSGSMSRVRACAGYVTDGAALYAVAILVNNFSCTQSRMKADVEQLLLSLFGQILNNVK